MKKLVGVLAGVLGFALIMALPLGAVSLVAYNFAVATTPDLLPIWAAVPIGLVVGTLILLGATAISGTDLTDLFVSSAIIVVLSLVLLPIAPRMKTQRLRRQGVVSVRVEKRTPQGPR